MTASEIVGLLAERHRGDVFVPECKVGSTLSGAPGQENGARAMDAFAIKKTWTHTHAIGYEVKVSRADYQRDIHSGKHRAYLPPLTHFYWVTPPDLLHDAVIPTGHGWLEVREGELVERVRAKRMESREGALLDLLKYVVFWRAEVRP